MYTYVSSAKTTCSMPQCTSVVILFTSNFVFQQVQITADNIQQVADTISMIVQTNSTEDQSPENLEVVTNVLSNTVNLLENISVSAEVRMLVYHFVPTLCASSPQV